MSDETTEVFQPRPMSTTQLAEAVAEETGIYVGDVKIVLRATVDVIVRQAAEGYRVFITNFGSFVGYNSRARYARNISTGERILVPETRRIRFTSAPRNKELVKHQHSVVNGVPITTKKRGKGQVAKKKEEGN